MDLNKLKQTFLSIPEPAKDSIIGFGTSATAIALTFPAESLAKQFHVTDSAKANTRTLVKDMSKRGIRGFYQGLGPALITQPMFWSVYFPLYKMLKHQNPENKFYWNMGNAYIASGVAAAVSNPLWVIRQRMQTEIIKKKRNTYTSLVKELYRENGIKTFFRGLNVTLVKNVQMMLLMPLFDVWKQQAQNGESVWTQIGFGTTAAVALSAASAKIISSTGVYPLDVLRTNIRFVEAKNITYKQVLSDVIMKRTGGVLNLFRGVGWYWVSAAGMFAIMQGLRSSIDRKR